MAMYWPHGNPNQYWNYASAPQPNMMYPNALHPYYPNPYLPMSSLRYTGPVDNRREDGRDFVPLKDYGPEPFSIDISDAAEQNRAFRRALWTGKHLQLTLMSIGVGEDIGLERHANLDQFIRIEEGRGLVKMGNNKENLSFQRQVSEDDILIIPAGTWHNLINIGNRPIKLYSIYAPPQHPHGTVHETKAEAEAHRTS